jgi:signal transduction histidine kinase
MNQELLRSEDNVDSTVTPGGDVFVPSLREESLRYGEVSFFGLEQALSAIAHELSFADRARLRILVTGKPKELDAYLQDQVYLIVREALVNAMVHSNASSVEAEIEYLPGKLRVIIRDNGHGINPQSLPHSSHRGLLKMRERASNIGAQFRIWSSCAAGTEVEVSVPECVAQAFRAGGLV